MEIIHANGRATQEVETFAEAKEALKAVYGADVTLADDWDSRTPETERLLVWRNEEDAADCGAPNSSMGSMGANAVAEIVRPMRG